MGGRPARCRLVGALVSRLSPARAAALKALSQIRRREARARDYLRAAPELASLDARDRALATRLVLGAVAARGEVDRVVDARLRSRSSLEPRVRDALRIAAFEILYLETPTVAAVSQGVELVRSVSPRAAGLANAVLRRVAQEDAAALADARTSVATGSYTTFDLRRVGGLPTWLAVRAMEDLGHEEAARYAESALTPPAATVAANLAKHTAEETSALLAEAGCGPEEGPVPGSFVLGAPANLASSCLVEACDVLPCDLAAQEVVRLAAEGLAPGARVLEVGQGRGTKSVLLAMRGLEVTSVEVDAKKSAAAAQRMETAGVDVRVRCVCDDGRMLERIDGTFDLVFVDAPCSGTGTLARHPEIAWGLDPSAPAELACLQRQILSTAAGRVAPGGRLVYSTCSMLCEENEAVARAAGLEDCRRVAFAGSDRHFIALSL